jgi:hypothetical protein
MPKFGRRSNLNLCTCHPDLQRLFREVVKTYDCTVDWGHRNEDQQNEMYLAIPPITKVQYPNSKHNSLPSMAADVVPFIDGKMCWEPRQCYHFAGYVQATADRLGIKIRLGADWDSDNNVNDQTFRDIIHFELVEE